MAQNLDTAKHKQIYEDEQIDSGIISGEIGSFIDSQEDIAEFPSKHSKPLSKPHISSNQGKDYKADICQTDSGYLSGKIDSQEIPDFELIDDKDLKAIHDIIDSEQHHCDSGIKKDISKTKQKEEESMYVDITESRLSSGQSLTENFSNLKVNDLNKPKSSSSKLLPQHRKGVRSDSLKLFKQDEDGDTLLMIAIFHKYVKLVLALIRKAEHPFLLDTPNDAAETPLHLAVQTEQHEVARWLIVAGAKPCPRDAEGNSPLHLAAKQGNLECVKAITRKVKEDSRNKLKLRYKHVGYEKPNLDQWNFVGQTCLHVAAMNGYLDIVKHLVECGADVNAREGLSGLTPLHYAVQREDEEMVKYLLDCKTSKPNVTNYGGLNALQLRRQVCDRIKVILKSKGLDSPYSTDESDSDYSDDEEMLYEPIKPVSLGLNTASSLVTA